MNIENRIFDPIAILENTEEYPINPETGCPLWIENYANAVEDKEYPKNNWRTREVFNG